MNKDADSLKRYKLEIDTFENSYLKDNFSNYKIYDHTTLNYKYNKHSGYLINLDCYLDLKEKIDNYFKKLSFASTVIQSLNKLNNIEFRTSSYLVNMLFNSNKYIIINTRLWNIFGEKENNSPISYIIDGDFIILTLEDKIKLKLICKPHNNIISYKSFSSENNSCYHELMSNNQNINQIYKEINDYYSFEKQFILNLNQNKLENSYKEYCYLIDANWLKKWIEKVNYSEIKKMLLNFEGEKRIKNKIIYFEEKCRTKSTILQKITIKKFGNCKELKKYLENDYLAIVNSDFINNFEMFNIDYYICTAHGNNINLRIMGEEVVINSKNNFITLKQKSMNSNSNKSDLFQIYVKPLIDFFYFDTRIKTQINSQQKQESRDNNEIYYINKKAMDEYKEYYDYPTLTKYLNSQAFTTMYYQNNRNNYKNLLDLLKTYNEKYIEKINNKISTNKFIFAGDFYKIPSKLYNIGNNNIKYFEDFEILTKEIVNDLDQIGIIKKEYLTSGEYIIENKKILFYFNEINNSYLQIHYYDTQAEKFIAIYLIEDLLNNLTLSYFREIGIDYFLKKDRKNNLIKYGETPICNCYEIIKNEPSIEYDIETPYPKDTNNDLSKGYSKNIIYLLFYYALFKNDIEKKISQSKSLLYENQTKLEFHKYYLINKNIITEFLKCFWDDKIDEAITKNRLSLNSNINDNDLDFILLKEDFEELIKRINEKRVNFKEKFKNIDFYKIDIDYIKDVEELIYYPKDLMFLDSVCYNKFLNLLNITKDVSKMKDVEIDLNYNFGNLAIKSNESNFLNNKLHLIYIYFMEKINDQMNSISFKLDLILSFSNHNNFIDNINSIFSVNIRNNCFILQREFENQYKLKIHLSKVNQNKEYGDKLDKYLGMLVDLYLEFLQINNKMNLSDNDSSTFMQTDENYFIIDKQFINDFEEIVHFKEIKNILDKDKNLHPHYGNQKKDCLEKIKNELNPNIKDKLVESENYSNFNKLKSYSYKVKCSRLPNKIKYYDNFVIINNQIKNILITWTKINLLNSNFIEPVDFIFRNNKFFLKFELYIAIGHMEQNEQFIFENLVTPKVEYQVHYFFEVFKEKGYLFLNKFLSKGIIKHQYYTGYTYIDILADIFNVPQPIINNKEIKNPELNDHLKKIILLYLELQNNNIFESNSKQKEEVYLINPEILSNPCLIEIGSLIKNEKNVFELLLSLNSAKDGIEPSQFEEIISTKFNKEKLKILGEKYSSFKFKDLQPIKQNILLKDYKECNLYRMFIMIKKNRCDTRYSELGLYGLTKVYYTIVGNNDLIIDEKNRFIIIGNIGDNYFNVKYILYFNYSSDLESELRQIQLKGIEQYLKNNTVFIEGIKEDAISPIFTKNTEAGICYRLEPGVNDYRNKTNYYDYINNKKFLKAYKLCEYYKKLKQNINSVYLVKGNYYLINKKAMSIIKKFYYYNDIKAILDQIDPNEINQSNPSKILLYIVKSLSDDTFENLIENPSEMEKIENNLIEPEIEPVYAKNMDRNKESPLAWIHNNFEVIEDKIAKLLFNINSGYLFSFESNGYNLNDQFECVLKDGKIMIKNNKKNSWNTKEIVVIGSLNTDDSFINEYVLIYDQYYYSQVSELEKKDLNNYLRGIQFANDLSPIVINQINIIGQIVKLQNVKINIDNIDNQMDIEEKVPYEVTPKDNQFKKQNKTNIEKNKIKKKDKDNFPSLSDKEYNLDSIHNITSIKQYFAYPPLIGLDNIGATCYMNATLQCLCNIEKFVDYFKYNPHLIEVVRNDIGKTQLCSSFKLLIEKLWPDKIDDNRVYNKQGFFPSFNIFEAEGSFNSRSTNKSFPPEDFKTKISKMNSLFEGVAANDAKDLVQFLIMTLHEELNKAKVQNINNAVNNDQRNKQLMFQIFAQDFMISNKSVISDLFYGVNYNITQCGYCKTQSFNYQTYFFLVFPLEEVRIFKSQNNLNYNFNNNYFNSNEVNIYDCFFYDQKINYMTGNNIMYCNFCRQTCNSSMRTFLSTGPEILIIILNRGKGIQFKVKINFSLEIDLSNFIEMKQTGCRYKLIGVITHLGESGMGGHFIAYCKNPISGDWYKYNDSIVSKVENFQAEVIDFAMPYLLFYQKST